MADAKKCPFKVAGGIEDAKCSDDCAWFSNKEWCAVLEIAALREDIGKVIQNKK